MSNGCIAEARVRSERRLVSRLLAAPDSQVRAGGDRSPPGHRRRQTRGASCGGVHDRSRKRQFAKCGRWHRPPAIQRATIDANAPSADGPPLIGGEWRRGRTSVSNGNRLRCGGRSHLRAFGSLRFGVVLPFGRGECLAPKVPRSRPILTFLDSLVLRDEFVGVQDTGTAAGLVLATRCVRSRTSCGTAQIQTHAGPLPNCGPRRMH